MKRTIILAIAIVAAVVLISYIAAYAQCALTAEKAGCCGTCGGGADAVTAASAESGVVNDICPVMGGEVDSDTPYKVAYKGMVIGLCCEGCIGKFNADPEKYIGVIEEAEED